MKCGKCGHELEEGMRFCGYCGETVVKTAGQAVPEEANEKRICPECGSEVDPKRLFCGKCGAYMPIKPAVKKVNAEPAQPENSGNGEDSQAPRQVREKSDPAPSANGQQNDKAAVSSGEKKKAGQSTFAQMTAEPLLTVYNARMYKGKPSLIKGYEAHGTLMLFPDYLEYIVVSGKMWSDVLGASSLLGAVISMSVNQNAKGNLSGKIPLSEIALAKAEDFYKNRALILTMKNSAQISFVPVAGVAAMKDYKAAKEAGNLNLQNISDMADIIQDVVNY